MPILSAYVYAYKETDVWGWEKIPKWWSQAIFKGLFNDPSRRQFPRNWPEKGWRGYGSIYCSMLAQKGNTYGDYKLFIELFWLGFGKQDWASKLESCILMHYIKRLLAELNILYCMDSQNFQTNRIGYCNLIKVQNQIGLLLLNHLKISINMPYIIRNRSWEDSKLWRHIFNLRKGETQIIQQPIFEIINQPMDAKFLSFLPRLLNHRYSRNIVDLLLDIQLN